MQRIGQNKKLSEHFAQNLLQCEIEYKLSEHPSKQNVKKLLQLYTEGVEYYQSVRSSKYLYFQIKMSQIFHTASTISSINSSPQNKQPTAPIKQEQKIKSFKIKQKQSQIFQELVEKTDDKVTVSKVKEMINQEDLKHMERWEKMKNQLQDQDQKLKEKMRRRKSKALLSKSFSSAGIVGEVETKDTLFQANQETYLGNISHIKPIQVNFENIIKQNQSDDEQCEKIVNTFQV